MILADYHTHTKLCGHAAGDAADYAEEALKKGLKEIGFSDHLPFAVPGKKRYTMEEKDLATYHGWIGELKKRHKKLTVKIGIEADFVRGKTREIERLTGAYPYDYVIGSVHYLEGWAFDDPAEMNRWNEEDVNAVYMSYYKLLRESAGSGLYDIIGHPDLVKKFGHRSTDDLRDTIAETARVFKQTGVAIELNTSGLRKPVKEIYPSQEALNIYGEFKVPIVFGSDAHTPGDVGADFEKAREMAKIAGYTEYLIFTARKITAKEKL